MTRPFATTFLDQMASIPGRRPGARTSRQARAATHAVNRMDVYYIAMVAIVVAAFIVPILFVDITISMSEGNILALLTFVIIGLIGMAGLHRSATLHPFSLDCAHWIFV